LILGITVRERVSLLAPQLSLHIRDNSLHASLLAEGGPCLGEPVSGFLKNRAQKVEEVWMVLFGAGDFEVYENALRTIPWT
jgi:hypothetical protein